MELEFVNKYCDYKNTKLIEFLKSNIPSKWKEFFEREDMQKILEKISEDLYNRSQEETIYPPMEDIFRIFYVMSLEDIKVVILGLDPYPNKGSATGMSFSVRKGNIINKSLLNIMKEVKDCGFEVNKNCGDLSCWAKEGVFLLNIALTVRESSPESHLKIWCEFSKKIINYITKRNKNIIFLMWGEKANNYIKYFDKEFDGENIIKCSHPSPLSAFRSFFGSRCFIKVNERLSVIKKEPIDWSIDFIKQIFLYY